MLKIFITVFALILIGMFIWDVAEYRGSVKKSRQIGSVAEQCAEINGTTIVINKQGGLEVDCMPEISASVTFPGCATQSGTLKSNPIEPIFKN